MHAMLCIDMYPIWRNTLVSARVIVLSCDNSIRRSLRQTVATSAIERNFYPPNTWGLRCPNTGCPTILDVQDAELLASAALAPEDRSKSRVS